MYIPADVIDFEWPVHQAGYQRVRARIVLGPDRQPTRTRPLPRPHRLGRRDESAIAELLTGSGRPAGRMTQPLRNHPGLFRAFGALDPDDGNSCRRFADEHGLLGLGTWVVPRRGPREDVVRGERLADWKEHILLMRRAVRVWDLWAAN